MIKKHIISKLFCISVLSLSSCNFIKKGTLAQMFSCEFCEFFKNSFLYRTPPVAASEKRKHIYLEGWHYETFKVLYTFFSDFVSTLVIKEYAKCDPISKSNTGQVEAKWRQDAKNLSRIVTENGDIFASFIPSNLKQLTHKLHHPIEL